MRNFLILALSLVLLPLAAQEKLSQEQFLTQLKNGALLVRLQERSLAINALERRGDSSGAEDLRREQYLENKEIVLSFVHTFDFCPVYFFYASHSEQVRRGQLAGVLLDFQLNPIENTSQIEQYYIGEFTETPKLGITGFVLRDQNFLPFREPLPFYERKYRWFGLIEHSKAQMLENYNQRLWRKWRHK